MFLSTSTSYGIQIATGTLSIVSSTFNKVPAYGIFNGTNMTSSAAAANNWWTSVSGPTNPSNPSGTGTPVSDHVTYSPWLTSAP